MIGYVDVGTTHHLLFPVCLRLSVLQAWIALDDVHQLRDWVRTLQRSSEREHPGVHHNHGGMLLIFLLLMFQSGFVLYKWHRNLFILLYIALLALEIG